MMRKLFLVLGALALVAFCVGSANAGIIMDIKVGPGAGYDVAADGKTVTVTDPAAVLALQVWATVSGTNAVATDDTIQAVWGAVQATGLNTAVGTGRLQLTDAGTKGYISPFDNLASQAVTSADTLLGLTGAPAIGMLAYRSASPVVNSSLGQSYPLGTASWAMTGLTGQAGALASINFLLPSPNSVSGATFRIDNVAKTGTTGASLLTLGAPVTVNVATIPEPTTLVLLGMGALALVFIRRRK
jgi:hypothetical protein